MRKHLAILGFLWLPLTAGAAQAVPDMASERILVEYQKPTSAAHQAIYDMATKRRVLERMQAILAPFRLPIDLTLKTEECGGVSNAWYHRPVITICYEYLDEILQGAPKATTPEGITVSDALAGQFFYVVAHEFGHAVFDLLQLPSFGRFEDIADQFSTFMMLQLGNEEARRLISGAAYSYRNVLSSSMSVEPLKAFSDVHSLPQQRFFNLICLGYGADPDGIGRLVQDKYLPKERTQDCVREYNQVGFAFERLIGPHIDQDLSRKNWSK